MTNFSVSSSIISSLDIASFVKEKYALPATTKCRLLKTGINHTYRIDSGDERFIYRIYSLNWRTKEEISEELKLLQLLKQNNIGVAYPIADQSDNLINEINAPEGLRFGVLFSYAEGHKVLNFNTDIHFKIGKIMAQIHQLTENLSLNRPVYSTEVLLQNSIDQIENFLSPDTEEMQFLVSNSKVLEEKIVNVESHLLRRGIVHMDIWFDNLNISNADEITIFDFDFCGSGWLCLDIAYYILQLHNTEKEDAQRAVKEAAFYKGYESVQLINDTEKRLIPFLGVLMYYFYLGIQCSRFENWSNTFLNEVYLKRFITVLIKGYYEKIN